MTGNGHQEGKACSASAIQLLGQGTHDGGTGTGDAGHDGDGLADTHDESVFAVHLLQVLFALGNPIGEEQYHRGDEKAPAQKLAGKEHLHRVLEEQTYNDGRHGGDDEKAGELLNGFLQDSYDVLPKNHKYGDQRAHMQHDPEEQPRFLNAKDLLQQHQMAGAGNGQELGQALGHTQDNRLPDIHAHIPPF